MKIKLLITILASFYTLASHSQNDAIQVYKDYTVFKGDTLNQYNDSGQRFGKWLFFTPLNTYELMSVDKDTEYTNPHIIISDSVTIYDSDYIIDAVGFYKNGNKDRLWSYYYSNGKLQKEIFFNNGEIAKDFIVYYEDGNIMMNVKKTECCTFTILQYSNKGELVKERTICKEEIEKLFPAN